MAAILAAFTSLLIYNWLERQQVTIKPEAAKVEAAGVPAQMVAVAATNLSWGTKLTAEMLQLVPFPARSMPQGTFSTVESLQERVLIANVVAHEPILEAKLAPSDVTKGGIAAVTNPQKRAMAVRVDDVVGVAGFVQPGHKVDVLVTLTEDPPMTKTVLQNVLVLATGTEIERRGKEDKPTQVRVITVEVTPEEGEKLALAANEGKLQLALRNYLNAEPVLTRGATVSSLLNSYRLAEAPAPKHEAPAPKRETPAPRPVPEPPAKQVEVIKGSTVTTLTFK
jgi:pilus assembly protein CpaB